MEDNLIFNFNVLSLFRVSGTEKARIHCEALADALAKAHELGLIEPDRESDR